MRLSQNILIGALAALALAASARAADPSATDVLKKYDDAMAPKNAQMTAKMTLVRDDGTKRTYQMRTLKKGDDKSRVSFDQPKSMAGQEILRVGDNSWIYLPDIKRATNMSNKESFAGGDFSNADMLRANLSSDYAAAFGAGCGDDKTWCLDLTSKSAETAYAKIRMWLRKADVMPVKAQYFGTSGKLLRSSRYDDYKEFQKGYVRPAHVVMVNETVKNRETELTIESLKVDVDIPDQRFVLTDLGK